MNSFTSQLNKRIDSVNSLLCVGLDSDIEKLPQRFLDLEQPQFEFNKWIIDQVAGFVCAFKPNSAFYEARGAQGIEELQLTCEYIKSSYADIPIILDSKRGDIGNTNKGYAQFAFEYLGVDAITIEPYQGREAIQPFLDYAEKGIIVLCKTSNPGSGEFQDLELSEGSLLWQRVARQVAEEWNQHGNCVLVVGATYPEQLKQVREIVDEMPLLVPGIGAQGGDVEQTVQAGLDSNGRGMIINSSRSVIFAEEPAQVAREMRQDINRFR